ncbi:hypothetical protein CIW47_09990 [Mycolicibacterium sp. P1-5]|nr:hypothetical protein CIW47_09990 [Mycolicibacterium sp. P1-5]
MGSHRFGFFLRGKATGWAKAACGMERSDEVDPVHTPPRRFGRGRRGVDDAHRRGLQQQFRRSGPGRARLVEHYVAGHPQLDLERGQFGLEPGELRDQFRGAVLIDD